MQIKKYVLPFKAILAIDFDLTICMSDYPGLGDERKNAGDVMRQFVKQGYGIIINTCRTNEAQADAIKWMRKNDIPYHYINCNFPHLIEEYSADCRKISADVYIDDKCLTGLPEWGDIYNIVTKKFSGRLPLS